MNTGQRIVGIITGLVMIALSVLMVVNTELGLGAAAAILSISLSLYGLRCLLYYFSMARHMVGGKLLLYVGIIAMDLGAFTAMLGQTPRGYIILYLLGAHVFAGAVDILRGREAKSYGGSSWKLHIVHGAVNILVALACLVFLKSSNVIVWIYAAGLLYSALVRIASALRRSAIVYIQ